MSKTQMKIEIEDAIAALRVAEVLYSNACSWFTSSIPHSFTLELRKHMEHLKEVKRSL